MKTLATRGFAAGLAIALVLTVSPAVGARTQERKSDGKLAALMPQTDAWKQAEAPQTFFPESLYAYIDGAAESYLSYDFRELLVVQLRKDGTEATMTVEIYDMGEAANAFGIYSAERYPENQPVQVGELAYVEGEALNFLAGRYYVKLLSFGLKEGSAPALTEYALKIAAAVPGKSALPVFLKAFPAEGLVAQSEKYVKKNFLGYEFLHDGYIATYKADGREIDAFIVPRDTAAAAEADLGRLLESYTKDKLIPEKIALGYHVKNRYSQHAYVGVVGRAVCGVMRIPDGLEAAGEKLFGRLAGSAVRTPAGKG
jgi:hypothetical protein